MPDQTNVKPKGIIFALVAPSRSGKSALMLEALRRCNTIQVIKSTSTRIMKGPDDLVFYNLVSDQEFEELRKQDAFETIAPPYGAGAKLYGFAKKELSILERTNGVCACVQQTVPDLRAKGYIVKLIKVIARGRPDAGLAPERVQADLDRDKIEMEYDLEVVNDFAPGGFQKASDALEKYIKSFTAPAV